MHAKQFNHVWHRDLPAGTTDRQPGGLMAWYPARCSAPVMGEPHFVRVHNDLPTSNLGFGINQISTHMHNLHTPSESDGNPLMVTTRALLRLPLSQRLCRRPPVRGIGNPDEALVPCGITTTSWTSRRRTSTQVWRG